jgi:hypothetical protein
MKRNFCFKIAIILCAATTATCLAEPADLTELMKKSLVYLDISKSSYDLSQPWKQTQIFKKSGYGCAVGPYEVLTIADNVTNATFVQAMSYGKSTYIPATVKVVDYEYNLCLLELDEKSMGTPLTPLSFKELYPKGSQLTAYWLSSGNHLTTARSTLDRAEMRPSPTSFVRTLTFYATNVSRPFGAGQVCCYENDAVGIAAWGSESDAGLIPSESINRFLNNCKKESYNGFAAAGFRASTLLDPAVRKYLKVPDAIKHGVYVSDIYTLGTGSQELKQGDVILSVAGRQLNPYGRYEHPEYKRISFRHLLQQTPDGQVIPFEVVRDGKVISIDIQGLSIKSDNMLVPAYQYGKQPEYMVVAGYVFQKLNRDYLGLWGGDPSGKAPPHLYHYQRQLAFKPSDDREDIVILSYVLPAQINQGYQQLSRLVVDSVNGTKIKSMKNFVDTINNAPDDSVLEITFEMDSPVLVIPKDQLSSANAQIAQLYGISKMLHIDG